MAHPDADKSLLMDLFFAHAPIEPKHRTHFHAFMAKTHERLRTWRGGDKSAREATFGTAKGDDPIPPLADMIAREARLLCFDELQVTDIADAMVLGRLFKALFERQVVVVATSNRPPDQLYHNGINRQLFLPFIDLIKDTTEVVALSGERDWRADRIKRASAWFAYDQRAAFDSLWRDLGGEASEEAMSIMVAGRELRIERAVGGMARASFVELCLRPRGAADYLALTEHFHTLFLEEIPKLSPQQEEGARRFITLIDTLYEARIRLIVLAEGEPDEIYPKANKLFEFERTVSRLYEMRGPDWPPAA